MIIHIKSPCEADTEVYDGETGGLLDRIVRANLVTGAYGQVQLDDEITPPSTPVVVP